MARWTQRKRQQPSSKSSPRVSLHAQATIEHEDQRAEVDVGIAPLVLALWRSGFRTVSSCEAFPPAGGKAYVAFDDPGQAERFRTVVGTAQVLAVSAEDVANAPQDDSGIPIGTVAVAFPPSRIPAIVKRLDPSAAGS
jgi:hypothetical protein